MRALLTVLDSVGIGNAPDAASYGDEGANTLGHILEACPELSLPNLCSLGLVEMLGMNTTHKSHGTYRARYGPMRTRSAGKDTTTGHWEIAGIVLEEPFAVFERFPDKLVRAIELEAGVRFLGNHDFDMLFGHRRDLAGYARALEEFDAWLGDFLPQIEDEDLVIITADHGNDPTFRGSDHTCEQVPVFVLHRGESRNLGTRETFADIAATLAVFFELPERWPVGNAFLAEKAKCISQA